LIKSDLILLIWIGQRLFYEIIAICSCLSWTLKCWWRGTISSAIWCVINWLGSRLYLSHASWLFCQRRLLCFNYVWCHVQLFSVLILAIIVYRCDSIIFFVKSSNWSIPLHIKLFLCNKCCSWPHAILIKALHSIPNTTIHYRIAIIRWGIIIHDIWIIWILLLTHELSSWLISWLCRVLFLFKQLQSISDLRTTFWGWGIHAKTTHTAGTVTHPFLLDHIILEVLVVVHTSHHNCVWPSTAHHSIAFAELRWNRRTFHGPLPDFIWIYVSWLAHVRLRSVAHLCESTTIRVLIHLTATVECWVSWKISRKRRVRSTSNWRVNFTLAIIGWLHLLLLES